MKFYYLTVIAIFWSIHLFSQNVGIGTTMPMEKLDVNGNIKMTGNIINEAYQTPTLINNWVNFGGAYAPSAYYKDKDQRVHIIGLVKSGISANGTTIFVLPVGYRPLTGRLIFDILSDNGSARIDVDTVGNVVIMGNGSSTWMNMSGISFRTD